ncbi:MAG: hypothetical protein QM784_21680 [Polyangiaceae bacterium]
MTTPDDYVATTAYEVPFEFSLCDSVELLDEFYSPLPETQWYYPHPDPNVRTGVKSRWIYVIRLSSAKRALFGEYYADQNGMLSFMAGNARMQEEYDGRLPSSTNMREARLPSDINGFPEHYSFFVSSIRLSLSALNAILDYRHPEQTEQNEWLIGHWLPSPWLTLFNEAPLPKNGEPRGYTNENCVIYQSPAGRESYQVRAVDPLAVAERLVREYTAAADAVLDYAVANDGTANAAHLHGRHNKLFIARILKSLLEQPSHDPQSHPLGIADEFTDGSGAIARKYVDDWQKELESRVVLRETSGKKLAHFLDSELFRLVCSTYSAHQAQESEAYDQLLRAVGRAASRLGECLNGCTLIGKWLREPPYWLQTYVLPSSALSEAKFQVARKANAALLAMWEELTQGELATKPTEHREVLETLQTRVEYVVREKIFTVVKHRETYRVRDGRIATSVPITVFHASAIAEDSLRAALAPWIEGTEAVAATVFTRVTQMLEVLNLAASASAVLKDGGVDACVNLVGSTMDAASAFSTLLRIAELEKVALGSISAIIDTYLSTSAAAEAYRRNDFGSVTGNAIAGLGSSLIFVGAMDALVASSATTIGVSAPAASYLGLSAGGWGAIVVGVGVAAAYFLGHTELETFVRHCCFGRSYGESDAHPRWSSTPLSAWRGGKVGGNTWDGNERFDVQLESLFVLIARFTVEYLHETAVRVTPGYLLPESKFLIRVVTIGVSSKSDIRREFELSICLATRTVTQVAGDPANLDCVNFDSSPNGDIRSFSATFEPREGTVPPFSFTRSNVACWIRLDLLGNGRLFVPLRPPGVHMDLRVALTKKTHRSEDY